MDERSLYVAPFPYDCKLDTLTDFFSKIAPIKCVRMRRNITTKDFRGSIFVEFESKETAEKVCPALRRIQGLGFCDVRMRGKVTTEDFKIRILAM